MDRETELRMQLAALHREYQGRAEPIVKELAEIIASKPPVPIVIIMDEAGRIIEPITEAGRITEPMIERVPTVVIGHRPARYPGEPLNFREIGRRAGGAPWMLEA